jgi:acetyl-CoA carboxylase biotin carboxyl carrier protein
VVKGQTLCILEAMKLMNELQAETAGVIREVCVENGEPVEYGQVLFRIEPEA